jgi:hypothetical protein
MAYILEACVGGNGFVAGKQFKERQNVFVAVQVRAPAPLIENRPSFRLLLRKQIRLIPGINHVEISSESEEFAP